MNADSVYRMGSYSDSHIKEFGRSGFKVIEYLSYMEGNGAGNMLIYSLTVN